MLDFGGHGVEFLSVLIFLSDCVLMPSEQGIGSYAAPPDVVFSTFVGTQPYTCKRNTTFPVSMTRRQIAIVDAVRLTVAVGG